MSKLVEGIKDRMVAAAREAAPAVVDAAQKAATAAAEKVAEAVADAKNAAGETSVASEPATAAEPVAAAHTPEGAIFNPENARGNLHLGIDVGSTTVKLAVLNDDNQIVYAKYQRHHTDVRACARDLFEGAATVLPTAQMTCAITGSGGLLLSQWLDLEFVQEVIASKRAVETLIPATDVAIELGGEDAKIIYFDNGIEQRMNGTCARRHRARSSIRWPLCCTPTPVASTSSLPTPPPSIPSPAVAAFLPRPTCSRCSTRAPAPRTSPPPSSRRS